MENFSKKNLNSLSPVSTRYIHHNIAIIFLQPYIYPSYLPQSPLSLLPSLSRVCVGNKPFPKLPAAWIPTKVESPGAPCWPSLPGFSVADSSGERGTAFPAEGKVTGKPRRLGGADGPPGWSGITARGGGQRGRGGGAGGVRGGMAQAAPDQPQVLEHLQQGLTSTVYDTR